MRSDVLAGHGVTLPLGFHQNRVAGFPRPNRKRIAASRRKVVSRSLPLARPLQHSSLVVIPAHRPCLPRRSVGEGGSLFPKAWLYLARSRSLDRYLTALPAMSLAPVAPFA